MKKNIVALILLIWSCMIFSETITLDLPHLEQTRDAGNTRLITESASFQTPEPGAPDIPVVTHFFELPYGKSISDVQIQATGIQSIHLASPLSPVQQAAPLSQYINISRIESISPEKNPASYLYRYGSGISGNRSIGWIAVYRCLYDIENQTLEVPESMNLEIQFTEDTIQPSIANTPASARVAATLLNEAVRERTASAYLLITGDNLLPAYEPLLAWRYRCGYDTYSQTVQWIEANEEGGDTQEKIRNYIIEMVNEYQVAFVTLAGDNDIIPVRYFFAFDCAYGIYEDENIIPADMYYAALDGDWDANANGIYGEDDDNPDYLPDVFLSRISASTQAQVESYVDRLIAHEKGEIEDYEFAGGVSMQLWPGSDSELAQQYIYERYFPDSYDISLLYDEENSLANAMDLISQNPNIFQHTGHASTSVLSLEEGSIRVENVNNMENSTGLFYSIGCWSAAMDYNSVGERLVTPDTGGFLAYVGNSRYGWGAPSAPRFGFSEYFQKEFFRILFEETELVSEVNVMQKLPFIPMYPGTSVYKWCAYQLNMIGDSAFRLFAENPCELQYNVVTTQNSIIVDVWSYHGAVEGAWVALNPTLRAQTDASGRATIAFDEPATGTLSVVAPRFKPVIVENFSAETGMRPYISNLLWDGGDNLLTPGQDFGLEVHLANPGSEPLTIQYNVSSPQDSLLTFVNPEGSLVLPANSESTPFNVAGSMVSTQDEPDWNQTMRIDIQILQDGEELFTHSTYAYPNKPFVTTSVQVERESEYLYNIHLNLENTGTLSTTGMTIYSNVLGGYGNFPVMPLELMDIFPVGGTIECSIPLTVSESAPDDFLGRFMFVFQTYERAEVFSCAMIIQVPIGDISMSEDFEGENTWEGDDAWQIVDTYSYEGSQSLSCRPESPGTYSIATPWQPFMSDADISFQYKYKMPMYGDDGVFVVFETEAMMDTLLFLGSGGALEGGRPAPEVYIEGDWSEYRFNPNEMLLAPPVPGSLFRLRFEFLYAEELEGFNEYGNMDDIGVFIDQFAYLIPVNDNDVDNDTEEPLMLNIFPNPVTRSQFLTIAFSNALGKDTEIDLFNIRGQKVRSFRIADQRAVVWNLKDASGKNAASGVYFARIKTGRQTVTQKFLLVR